MGEGMDWIELHKIRGNSWLAQDLLALQGGLCSMELVQFS
jgi:hypothetical protein